MGLLEVIICTVVISFCMSVMTAAIVHYKLTKKHEEEQGRLKSKVYMLEEMLHNMKEYYTEHMAKYH